MKLTSQCECGHKLPFVKTPFQTTERRRCPKCEMLHWVDNAPIDWAKVNNVNTLRNKADLQGKVFFIWR